MKAGIIGYGGYLPRLRLSRQAVYEANAWFAPGMKGRARGSRAMANWDEDSVTMAVAAARDCLGADEDRSHIGGLILVSNTLPFADRLNAGIAAAALTLDEDVDAIDLTGTRRAALSGISQAIAKAGMLEANVLLAASDLRKTRAASAAELDYGDGAAALLFGTGTVLAEFLGSAAVTVDFVDHFRGAGADFDYVWEERWIRDEGVTKIAPRAVETALDKAGLAATGIHHFIFPTAMAGLAAQLARTCGLDPSAVVDTLAAQIGDIGAGHALLVLAHVLERAEPGQNILLLEFGSGAEAVVLRVTEAIRSFRPKRGVSAWLDRRLEETSYTKFLAFRGQLELEKGMRGEQDKKTALSTLYRHRAAIMGLIAGRCRETGSVHFPPSRLSYDTVGAALDTQEPYKLADRKARVLSWSAETLSYYMAPPHHFGQVDFEGGGRILMEFTDVAPGEVDTGMEMEMVFRVKDRDPLRNFTRYFWKATPAGAA